MSLKFVANNGNKFISNTLEELTEDTFNAKFLGASKVCILELDDKTGHQLSRGMNTTVTGSYKAFMAAVRKNFKNRKSNVITPVPVLTVEQMPVHISSVEEENVPVIEYVDPENTSGVGKVKAAFITLAVALALVFGVFFLF